MMRKGLFQCAIFTFLVQYTSEGPEGNFKIGRELLSRRMGPSSDGLLRIWCCSTPFNYDERFLEIYIYTAENSEIIHSLFNNKKKK